jgi:hypothetical protein
MSERVDKEETPLLAQIALDWIRATAIFFARNQAFWVALGDKTDAYEALLRAARREAARRAAGIEDAQ